MTIGLDGNEANVKNRVGSGVYAFELLKQFSKYKQNFSLNKQHKFCVYLKDNPFSDLPKESENFRYKVFGPKKMWTQFALPLKLTFGQKPDVFFSMGHYGPRFSKVPYSIIIFDLSYLHFPELFKKEDLYQLQNWSNYSIKNAAHIFTISKSTQDDIIKHYGTNPSKISVTYVGYDQDKFKPQPKSKINNVKKKFKIIGDYIIFVGTLQPRKNIERLTEAFYKLTHHSSLTRPERSRRITHHYQLVIVGKKGWFYESIFKKVKQLNLEDKIIFTDYARDLDLPSLISGAAVFVLPSLWEGFGIPVIEAQACGVPTVVSNTSSLPEIVGLSSSRHPERSEGSSAVLVDPESVNSIANGTRKVLTNENIRKKLIQKGFENAKRFSWQRCAEQTLEVLEKVATKQAP